MYIICVVVYKYARMCVCTMDHLMSHKLTIKSTRYGIEIGDFQKLWLLI